MNFVDVVMEASRCIHDRVLDTFDDINYYSPNSNITTNSQLYQQTQLNQGQDESQVSSLSTSTI
jgi:hypothetical protein